MRRGRRCGAARYPARSAGATAPALSRPRTRCLQVKLNTDESPSVATEYGIRSIPTVMIFKNGVKCDTVIGAVPKSTLVSTIDKYI